jgi:hypothetical protein
MTLRGALVAAPELEGLIEVAGDAVAAYDGEREAAVGRAFMKRSTST